MEGLWKKLLDNYKVVVSQFQDNKILVAKYYSLMISMCLFFHENHLFINHSMYDYLFSLLMKEMNGGNLGVLEFNHDYYKGTKIHSTSGVIIEILESFLNDIDDSTNLSSVILQFKKLNKVMRKGWIIRGVNPEYYESDTIHTMQMFALVSMYVNSCPSISDEDKLKMYEMALIHEIPESIGGDNALLDKNYQTEHDKEKIYTKNIFKNIESGEYFYNLWYEFETLGSEAARFIYEVDKIDPILKALYLGEVLNRTDLFDDFYSYEEKRETFKNSRIRKLYLLSKKGK